MNVFSKYRRILPLFGALLLLIGVGAAIHKETSKGQTSRKQASHVTVKQVSSLLADVEYQNNNLFKAHHVDARPRLGQPATRIRVPSIGINSPVISTGIVKGTWQVADWAVGYLQGSAKPGTCTSTDFIRTCSTDLAAHDDIKGELFKNIGNLKNGATVFLYTKSTVFTYKVDGRQIVAPTNGSVLFAPAKQIEMVTCTPYWVDTSRLVITAALVRERPRSGA